jgi:hypothetical protein
MSQRLCDYCCAAAATPSIGPSAAVRHTDATATAAAATIDDAAAVAVTDACWVTHFIFLQ